MKTLILFLALLVIFGCANNDDKAVPKAEQPVKEKTDISASEVSSIKEVQLVGLAETTAVRVGLENDSVVISTMTIANGQSVFKTVFYPKVNDFKQINYSDKGLFDFKFDTKIASSRTVDTLFSKFKKLMQVYHLKDVYRCRSSKFWPQMVDYTPDKRGPGLLRLEQELYFPSLEAEAYLVFDFNSEKLFDIVFRKTPDHLEGDYYTSGLGSQLTQSLGTFSLFCKEGYKTLKPNYIGEEFLKDIDKDASDLADIYIQRYIPNAMTLDLNKMGLGNELRNLSQIMSELKKHRAFISESHWDFYIHSIQTVRGFHN
ncbi:MAG: hypothetical protein L6Q37_11435 [Bdellovibrionaceae bacterium]|nr:hypothetical protein [Pseudobdellovibrionaceae bacterium]NUM59836.1 hypothetical protein [Pseudobdellovibrionaceae bacterium]